MTLCRVEDVWVPTGRELVTLSWVLAVFTGGALWGISRFPGRRGNLWTAAGLGIMAIPAWQVFILVLPDMAKTFCVNGNVAAILPSAPGPALAPDLSAQFIGQLLWLGYIAVGAMVWLQGTRPGWWRRPTAQAVAAGVAPLVPMGRGELRSLRLGMAAFPLLAAANLILVAATRLTTPYFSRITAYHAVLLSVAAGCTEELLYRGVIQQSIRHLVGAGSAGAVRRYVAIVVAIVIQAVIFAYAHGGYGDPKVMLFAVLFAGVVGVVVQLFGIWTGIILHILIDFYGFVLGAPLDVGLIGVAAVVGVVILAVTILESRRAVAWLQTRGG